MQRKLLPQIIIFLILSFYTAKSFADSRIDSLELLLENTTDVEVRLATLDKIIDIYFDTDFRQVVIASGRGVKQAENANSKKWMPIFYEKLGRSYANSGLLDSVRIFFEKAVSGYKEIGNQKGVATTYFKLGWHGRATTNFDKAVEYDLLALRIMEELGDIKGVCSAYGRLSTSLYLQHKPIETLKYAQKSIEIGESNDVGEELFYAYISAGDAYMLIGNNGEGDKKEMKGNEVKVNYQKSLEMYNKAFAYGQKIGRGEDSFVNLINQQGNAYKKLGKYDLALEKYTASYQLAKKLNYESYFPLVKANIAEIQKLRGEFQKSLVAFKEVLEMYEDDETTKDKIEWYAHISEIYEELSDYENALINYKLERALTDEALSLEKENALNAIKTEFETEKNEAKILAQSKQISQQRWLQIISLCFVGLLGLLLFQAYRNAKSRKRINEALASSNKELDFKNKQNELLLKEIHHRVKNNLQTISSLLSLQSSTIKDKGAFDAVQESRNRVSSMALIHQKLYQGKNLAAIEMRDYFETIGSAILNSFGEKANGVVLDVDMSEIEMDVDTAIPIGLITNELITNSLKYAFKKTDSGKIFISMNQVEDNLIQLKIADDGVNEMAGISEGGTGFGTMLVSLLTTQLGGELKQTTGEGTVTVIEFTLDKTAA